MARVTIPPQHVIDDFQRDGVVCIRGLFSTEQITALQEAIAENMKNPSELAQVASNKDDPGLFFEDFCNWQRIEGYRRFIVDSKIGQVAAALTKSSTVRLYHDHLLVKEPGTVQATPWHQDQPYYNIDGQQTVSMWVPVDNVGRESSLEFIAGSHLGPWCLPRTFLHRHAKWFPEGSLMELPDIDANRSKYKLLSWEMEPGDALFFHMLTVHGSAGVCGPNQRRAFSVRFIGDDVTFAPRQWRTSPPFVGLESQLTPGATMDHPLFPVLHAQQEHDAGN